MTWANMTKAGSLKGRKMAGQQVVGAPAWTKRSHQVLLQPPIKHCQSNWRCSKVMTSVATNPRLLKTGGCCTRAPTAHLGLPFLEASSHWSLRRGISVEPWTYLSLLLCLYPCACQPLSALTARHAEGLPKTKQLLWNPAEKPQSRAATVERATLSLCWSQRRKVQKRKIQSSQLLEHRQRVTTSPLTTFSNACSDQTCQQDVLKNILNMLFSQIQAKNLFQGVKQGWTLLNWNHRPLQMQEKAKMQRHLLEKSCTSSP